MAIAAKTNDNSGAALDAKIVAQTAAIAAAGDPQSKASLTTALAKTQLDAITHYLSIGTISAGAALTTLGLSATSLPQSFAAKAKYGAQGSNISARITALTTSAAAAGPGQSDAAQRLQAANVELFLELINQGVTTPALVLSTLS